MRDIVEKDGVISKRDWECALLTAICDEIRTGNVAAQSSKRFGRFDNFFISDEQWAAQRVTFFQRAGLPVKPEDVPAYLTTRLNKAYDTFLATLPDNAYATVDEKGWVLSTDSADKLDKETEKRFDALENWLSDNLRQIKLPELLIEVDNELHFTQPFLPSVYQAEREPESVAIFWLLSWPMVAILDPLQWLGQLKVLPTIKSSELLTGSYPRELSVRLWLN